MKESSVRKRVGAIQNVADLELTRLNCGTLQRLAQLYSTCIVISKSDLRLGPHGPLFGRLGYWGQGGGEEGVEGGETVSLDNANRSNKGSEQSSNWPRVMRIGGRMAGLECQSPDRVQLEGKSPPGCYSLGLPGKTSVTSVRSPRSYFWVIHTFTPSVDSSDKWGYNNCLALSPADVRNNSNGYENSLQTLSSLQER